MRIPFGPLAGTDNAFKLSTGLSVSINDITNLFMATQSAA
jgi:hypothetical protein